LSPTLPTKHAKYFAEGIATFCLVFLGTGAIVVNQEFSNALTHLGVSFVFGFVVLAMIYTFGSISGAHMNPAVTLGFLVAKRTTIKESSIYIVAQILGALAASLLLRFLFSTSPTLGQTVPSGSAMQSFVIELMLTAILMMVIFGVAHNSQAEGLMAGVAIGATIAMEALVAGPISGASMNPARSLAPAVVSGDFSSLWVYMLAPIIGSVVVAKIFPMFRCEPSNPKEKMGCC
jgi:aquaporin Z